MAVQKILVNVIGNALKFAPVNGLVAIAVSSDSDGMISYVIDNEPGIPEDRLSAVLKQFLQADGGLPWRHEGAGLDLPIAKALADAPWWQPRDRECAGFSIFQLGPNRSLLSP